MVVFSTRLSQIVGLHGIYSGKIKQWMTLALTN